MGGHVEGPELPGVGEHILGAFPGVAGGLGALATGPSRGQPPSWMRQAACAADGVDTSWWFDRGHAAAARRICRGCPVLNECRHYCDELESTQPFAHWAGVWAGETPKERRQRRRGEAS